MTIPNRDIEDLLETTFNGIYPDSFVRVYNVETDKNGDFVVKTEIRVEVDQKFSKPEMLDNQGFGRIALIKKKFLASCRKELTKLLK